jgi:hypothetical protein
MKPAQEFDPAYMEALYKYGFDEARNGYPWAKYPPWIPPPPEAPKAGPKR